MVPAHIRSIVRSSVFCFSMQETATRFCDRSAHTMAVILGDHDGCKGEFWVVTMGDAARLERAGYEWLPLAAY